MSRIRCSSTDLGCPVARTMNLQVADMWNNILNIMMSGDYMMDIDMDFIDFKDVHRFPPIFINFHGLS